MRAAAPGDVSPLRAEAESIAREAIAAMRPRAAVLRALAGWRPHGRVLVAAVGKAAWAMAAAALEALPAPPAGGVIITKYGHLGGPLPSLATFEAGHPLPDQNSLEATAALLAMTADLSPDDTVLLLLSGGGSALLEKPLVPLSELQTLTDCLLRGGADIREINTVRKRLSAVKGGRLAAHCAPAKVWALLLSDVLGDAPDAIASGPAVPDPTTCAEAAAIARRYRLPLSAAAAACLATETPKALPHAHSAIIGGVGGLCAAAADACRARGWQPLLLTDRLDCEAAAAGRFLAACLRTHAGRGQRLALIAGGETVVRVRGRGLGGRCQELALAAAPLLAGLGGVGLLAVGSDGTDGPTDAAGGYVDGDTQAKLHAAGLSAAEALMQNDSYHALAAGGGLVFTGPTGTNVNDLLLALCEG